MLDIRLTWLVGGLLLLWIVAVVRKAKSDQRRTGQRASRTVLFLFIATILVPVLLLLVVDRAVGFTAPALFRAVGIVYPPLSSAKYDTTEFQVETTMNNMGFRGRELDSANRPPIRIIAVGDSFTFGWGVGDEEAWPRVLERRLIDAGHQVEVLNLGCPGTDPIDHTAIIGRGVIALKPDYVIMAILQADDIAQMNDRKRTAWYTEDDTSVIVHLFHGMYPNLTMGVQGALGRSLFRAHQTHTRDVWRMAALEVADKLMRDTNTAERFRKLPQNVHEVFLAGNLNPWIVSIAVKYPDYMLFTLNLDNTNGRDCMRKLFKCVNMASAISWRNDAKLVVASVPEGMYVCRRALESRLRIGFEGDERLLEATLQDDVIAAAAEATGVPFMSATQAFRQAAVEQELFFEFDGHFNKAGHELYGTVLADQLGRMLAE